MPLSMVSAPAVPAPAPAPAPAPVPAILPLRFLRGRKGGQQASYNGYVYTHDRRRPDGSR